MFDNRASAHRERHARSLVWSGAFLALLLALSAPLALADLSARSVTETETATEQPASPPGLTLANVYREGIDLSRYWVSEKLDGVRAYWDGRRLITRGGHPIAAPDWFTAGFPTLALDGELWMGRGTFETLSGTVRRLEPDHDAWRAVRYRVFDLPGMEAPFGERLQTLERLLADTQNPHIAPVEQFRVADHADLMARLETIVAADGEGLMLHHEDAPYRAGRSDDLIKVKLYLDAEAQVIAHLPGKGKYAGMMGALLVEEPSGQRFRLGTGFSDAERRSPPPIGRTVTFKYHGRTRNGVPRFASFLRVRD
ncbi:DNA ligase [Allochromatium palmeri]|uniref:DNA ligase n=1 Tax=Allochromatium palmeri TaxID=231048 RepID=A0A6N8EB29_9GAMM|nr:DNA ligase [Allochromatium palmeri]MTW19747.1 DNA ligase [Allochromatium palmeri]